MIDYDSIKNKQTNNRNNPSHELEINNKKNQNLNIKKD